ncbi:hypothetical protein EVAR_46919_1 [Eumeta japonica]|uniref:Uncharacterized protein n=1 Tax=Eumeta variegata TaxID=151549 RepID=A0A4C1Y208_EUMVA|nr:hypothetical protein EVAR_46919_1 [Eumeta japonica]
MGWTTDAKVTDLLRVDFIQLSLQIGGAAREQNKIMDTSPVPRWPAFNPTEARLEMKNYGSTVAVTSPVSSIRNPTVCIGRNVHYR